MAKEKGGSSNVYTSMHLPLLRVEGLESKSSSRHAYAGVVQYDSVAHLAAIIKDMALSIASSSKVLLHGEEITLTDHTEFNVCSYQRGCSISFESISELWVVVLLFCSVPRKVHPH